MLKAEELTKNLTIGMTNEASETVSDANIARTVKCGSLAVYSTPMMIARMEEAAATLAEKNLPSSFTSVGILMNVAHTAATPQGMKVTAKATLTEIEGKKLVFAVEAFDECGEIGRGTHERFIVEKVKFQEKADRKKI